MSRYLIKRLAQSIVTLFAVTIIIFALARVSGDPADAYLPPEVTEATRERMRQHWGLDQPVHIQYLSFLGNALQGDFGESLRVPGRGALELVLSRLWASLELGALAALLSVVVAIPIGVISAVYKGSIIDIIGKTIAILGQSLPQFWIGIIFIWIFGVTLGWLPIAGRGTARHLIMPVIVIGWFQVAALMRLVRSSMLEALDSEYVKLARIKGVSQRSLVWKHCLRNASIPPLTYAGIMIRYMIVGSIATEVVFGWPGVARLVLESVQARDFQVVQTVALVFSIGVILANLLVDILYAYIDPRIRYD